MNIYQKLIEVRKSCAYLKKDNAGYKFQFVSSSQTLGSLRSEMDKQGLLLIPSVLEKVVSDHTTAKEGHEYFTELVMMFTWVNADNPEEKIECKWYGQGLDTGEKGVGKALTYAEKYFLLKFFNIATDKDDPDSFQGKHETKQNNPVIKAEPIQLSMAAAEFLTNFESAKDLKALQNYAALVKDQISLLPDGERKCLQDQYILIAKKYKKGKK